MTAPRSCLSVPATAPRFFARAAESAADEVMLDLEDSVAPAAKAGARAEVVAALNRYGYGGKVRAVRVNGVATPWCAEDVRIVLEGAGDRVDRLVVPKVDDASHVHFVHHLVTQTEARLGLAHRIELELQIESPAGLERAAAAGSASDRCAALVFGPVDFAAALGMAAGPDSLPPPAQAGWASYLARMLVAARACGLAAVDGPFPPVRDLAGLRASARLAAALGYDGKWALNPAQAEVINEVFSPSQAEFDRALAIVIAHGEAAARSAGALLVGGEMVDEATRKAAQATVDRGRRSGLGAGPAAGGGSR